MVHSFIFNLKILNKIHICSKSYPRRRPERFEVKIVHLFSKENTHIYFTLEGNIRGCRQGRKLFYKNKKTGSISGGKKKSGPNLEIKLIRISMAGRLHVYQTSMFLSWNRFKITLKCQRLLLIFFNTPQSSLMRIH